LVGRGGNLRPRPGRKRERGEASISFLAGEKEERRGNLVGPERRTRSSLSRPLRGEGKGKKKRELRPSLERRKEGESRRHLLSRPSGKGANYSFSCTGRKG